MISKYDMILWLYLFLHYIDLLIAAIFELYRVKSIAILYLIIRNSYLIKTIV